MKQATEKEPSNILFYQLLDKLLPANVPFIYLKEIIYAEEKFIFLDAREREEYEVSHLQNAVFIGYSDFELANLPKLQENVKVVVYCSVGWRSARIGKKLMDNGYKNVYNLYGGIFEWCNNKQPVFNENGKVNSVHAYNNAWKVCLRKGVKRIL